MLKLNKLKFKNIGRFVDLQEISFSDLNGLIQVDGSNSNTGGSSGAGKSTIFNALDFLFGLNTISTSSLQSRITEDPIFVEAEFDFNGQNLIISRSKKLKIDLNGEITTGSSKITEEKLDQILSIPRHLFRPMLHKKQKEPGFFLNFTPSETNSFLTDCLGLTDYKNKLNNLDLKINDISKKIELLDRDIHSNKTGLEATQNAIKALGSAPKKNIDQKTILQIKENLDSFKFKLNRLLEKNKKEIEDLNKERPILDFKEYDLTNLKKYENQLFEINEKINDLKLKNKDNEFFIQKSLSDIKIKKIELSDKIKISKKSKEDAKKLALEVLKIRNSICPKCEQSWINDAAKKEEQEILIKINELKTQIIEDSEFDTIKDSLENQENKILENSNKNNNKEILYLENEYKKIKKVYEEEKQKEQEHVTLEKNNAKEKFKIFEQKEKELKSKHDNECLNINKNIELYTKELNISVTTLKNYEENKKIYENSINNLKDQEAVFIKNLYEFNNTYEQYKSELQILEELKKIIKSYLSFSFDEILETISENATRIIQHIPNMSNATIQLEGIRETKDGKVKEEVNSVIHMDGEENVPIKTLSGGERAAVDIAIDIAVLGVIEERTNKGIDLFILDEPFTGLDSTNIEMVLEVLKNTSTNKKIVIVDHNPVVKEQISDRINVVRNGLTSKIF